MNGGTGGSTLCERLSWFPVAYGRTDVITISTHGISFAFLSLLKRCISLSDSLALRFAFALHIVALVENGMLGNYLVLMTDRWMK